MALKTIAHITENGLCGAKWQRKQPVENFIVFQSPALACSTIELNQETNRIGFCRRWNLPAPVAFGLRRSSSSEWKCERSWKGFTAAGSRRGRRARPNPTCQSMPIQCCKTWIASLSIYQRSTTSAGSCRCWKTLHFVHVGARVWAQFYSTYQNHKLINMVKEGRCAPRAGKENHICKKVASTGEEPARMQTVVWCVW